MLAKNVDTGKEAEIIELQQDFIIVRYPNREIQRDLANNWRCSCHGLPLVEKCDMTYVCLYEYLKGDI